MARSPIIKYIIEHQSTLLHIDFSREIWMIPDRVSGRKIGVSGNYPIFEIDVEGDMYRGKLFEFEGSVYGVGEFDRIRDDSDDVIRYRVVGEPTDIEFPKDAEPLCRPTDKFTLYPGEIKNFKESQAVETTIGRFIGNYLFLVYPFGDAIPYINEEMNADRIADEIGTRLVNGTLGPNAVSNIKDKYGSTLFLFGQATDMFCPNITEKVISPPKEISELLKRLVEENRAALDAGDASVMADIEAKVISEYKKYLKGDPAEDFLLKSKYFNVTLKKLYLAQGMTEKFGSPGQFVFIDQPMGEGWRVKDIPAILNETRQGSYQRAVETANGGVIAKLILRVFQDVRIVMADCKSPIGETIDGTAGQIREFIGSYAINPDKSLTLITEENQASFLGKPLVVRTPGYCKSEKGFCAKCFGHTFEVLKITSLAPEFNNFAKTQTTNSLKSMHGKSHKVVDISDINRFLVGQ